MPKFERKITIPFDAFQFNAEPRKTAEQHFVWDDVQHELPELDIYDVVVVQNIKEGQLVDDGSANALTLNIVERFYDEEGERNNNIYELVDTEWLVNVGIDSFAYEVMTHEQFLVFSQQEEV